MLHTPLCDMFQIRHPLIQAGMGIYRGLVTTPELVAAVCNAGGMGCIGASGLTSDELRQTVRKVQSLTDKPFGVDLLFPANLAVRRATREEIREDIRTNHPRQWQFVQELFEQFDLPKTQVDMEFTNTDDMTMAQADVVFEERVRLLVIALGDPGPLISKARQAGTKVAGLVGSVQHVRRQVAAGVDFIIAQGSEAGGHVGTISTFPLLPQVVDAAGGIPVVAAGGIADGRGVAAALALGSAGAWCGTVFLFSEEAGIHPANRAQLIGGRSEDFVASRYYTGKPARTFRNLIHKSWAGAGFDPLPMPHQKVLMDDFIHAARQAGRFEVTANPAGQVAGMLSEVRPAARIVTEMIAEAERVIRRSAALLQ